MSRSHTMTINKCLSGASVALSFEYGLFNDFLVRMEYKEKGLEYGTISVNDNFECKIILTHA